MRFTFCTVVTIYTPSYHPALTDTNYLYIYITNITDIYHFTSKCNVFIPPSHHKNFTYFYISITNHINNRWNKCTVWWFQMENKWQWSHSSLYYCKHLLKWSYRYCLLGKVVKTANSLELLYFFFLGKATNQTRKHGKKKKKTYR